MKEIIFSQQSKFHIQKFFDGLLHCIQKKCRGSSTQRSYITTTLIRISPKWNPVASMSIMYY
jgi:hypothetical protein